MKAVAWHEGDLVHKLRRIHGLTVEALAEHAQLNPSIIRRLEHGKTKQPDRDTVTKLAQVFGMTAGEFIDAVPQASLRVGAYVPTQHTGVTAAHAAAQVRSTSARSGETETDTAHGRDLVSTPGVVTNAKKTRPVSSTRGPTPRGILNRLDRLARTAEKNADVEEPAAPARAVGQHAPTPRAPSPGGRAPARKPRR